MTAAEQQAFDGMKDALEAMERATQTNDVRIQAAASQQCRVALSAAKAVLKPNCEGMRYYKNDACRAEGSDSPDCICWTPITKAVQPQAQGELGEIIGCFDAAIAEGLFEVMAETTDGRLKDLLERRLMHAYYAAKAVSEGDSAPTTVQQAANELIALAYRAGQVVTIERRPLKPLAMGNAEYVVDIRPVRGAS